MIEKKRGLCGVCPSGCAVILTLKDGKIEDIKADAGNPYGMLCVRGRAAREIVYSPDRLTSPLIRCGKRGEGCFRKASWEEALGTVAERMLRIKQEYGPQAVVYHGGRGTFEQSMKDLYIDWLFPFGSPNHASVGSLCAFASFLLAPVPTFGINGRTIKPDLENSNMVVVWGMNPRTSSPPFLFPRIKKAKKRGARVVAVDTMFSETAKTADEWIPVRSGTDGALALGMLRTIINEELYDEDIVMNWTHGFNELKDYVQQFTPSEVERLTLVPAERVVSFARELASCKSVSLVQFTGLEYSNSSVQNIRAVYLLWALTGHFDEIGGMVIDRQIQPGARKYKPPMPDIEPIGHRDFPFYCDYTRQAHYTRFPHTVLSGFPYPVKGVIIHGAATLANYPDPARFARAYSSLDLMVVIDRFPVSEMAYADVVLPATTLFEIESYQYYGDYIRLRQRLIEPFGEARNDSMILSDLANRLGYGHLYPKTERGLIEQIFVEHPHLLKQLDCNPDGVKLPQPEKSYRKWEKGLLRKDGKPGFETPSGKIEITSSILAGYGYDALPVYNDPIEGPIKDPELNKSYPLVLNTGARIINAYHSQHLNIPSLVRIQDKPQVIMNRTDADARGIKSGDRVIVHTKRGKVRFWASVGVSIPPGTVEANKGGGEPYQVDEWRNSNVNYLTDLDNCDPISGYPVFKALMCEVKKA
ncbi:MAG: molybdopterin-dependent oxidoreductase [Dehalococcoidaceae bacterium]|nr:molybdopterin-dependent oxidoreductase [Dehalococcoidaceae bacterium]